MNTHALIPLIATIAYIPLFGVLLVNRPWQREQRLFLLFLIPAMLWSLSDIIFRSYFLTEYKLLTFKFGICVVIWAVIQFHYVLRVFYQPQRTRMPLAYIFLAITIALIALGYIPQNIEITTGGVDVNYGIWLPILALFMLITLGARDIYLLTQRHRISYDPMERNRIIYLLAATAILIIFLFSSFAPFGGKFPIAHIGNLITACILTYAVIAHRLLDIRIVSRRALMYLVLYSGGAALFMLFIFLAGLVFGFSIDWATLGAVFGIGIPVIALFSNWVRPAWKKRVDRAFIGERYDYRRKLSDLTQKTYDATTLQEFGSQLTSLISNSIDCQRACLLLPQDENGDFASRFVYPPVEGNPMAQLKLKHDSAVVNWLKRKAKTLPRRNLSILPELQGMWRKEKEDIESAQVEMFVPLLRENNLVAILVVDNKRNEKPYAVEDIDLVEFIANRMAASMGKEYLHERLVQQEKELRLTSRLTTMITSSMNIEEIFEGFVQELKKVTKIDWASIILIEGDKLVPSALSTTTGSAWQTGEKTPLKGTATEWVCQEKRSLYEADLTQDTMFRTGKQHLEQGIRSIIYLPLIVKNEGIGSLIVASRQINAYNHEQISLLEQVALQIAAPIENTRLYARAAQRAHIDELTGLYNRRYFEEQLKEEIARHTRYGGIFSLCMLDLDSFKTYNDMYGHPSGDRLLAQIGEITRNSIRDTDRAFRYGGDEFIAILPETPAKDAYTVADRVREQIAAEMEAKENAVTCSIGVASYPSDGVLAGELVNAADTALYYAKHTGGNRTYLSSKVLSEPAPGMGSYARGTSLSAVYALVSAVDAKDAYTYDHSRKVSTYAVALAEAIGLAPDEVSRISTAALLHDIGKIGISDGILNRKERLSKEDWEVIKLHPRLGANIVGNVPGLVPCLGGILYHHERYDGKGYPERLKGEEIPIEARILAIADAYAAMSTTRPYRDAYRDDTVIQELEKGAGKQFDPELVKVFIGLIKAGFPEAVQVSQNTIEEQANS
ncbi:MAG: diguanylate cyclase [Chloroflexota bacterium]|nr:diguanylate cyclase [Chloroflexota bacterium]